MNHSVSSVCFSPNGKFVFYGCYDKFIRMIELKTKVHGYIGSHNDCILCIAISIDGCFIASGSVDKTIKIWNLKNSSSVLLG